uniref:TSA: Wollemia nobilis Ref_Wollemi_Transcript_28243_727 transcribed RNA sequence n=1 Tax=Wollemia nobilis TaxID=56998 RepID=A0A0C9S128_9CONI
MALQVSEDQRAGAEVYHGSEMCKQKSRELLGAVELPKGLLPMDDLEECGYVKETGFVWLKQKKRIEHRFKKIGKLVAYAPEITAYVEERKMKKLTGVKSKEILLWVTITEISIDDPASGKIYFKSSTGIGKTLPANAFELEEEVEEEK